MKVSATPTAKITSHAILSHVNVVTTFARRAASSRATAAASLSVSAANDAMRLSLPRISHRPAPIWISATTSSGQPIERYSVRVRRSATPAVAIAMPTASHTQPCAFSPEK